MGDAYQRISVPHYDAYTDNKQAERKNPPIHGKTACRSSNCGRLFCVYISNSSPMARISVIFPQYSFAQGMFLKRAMAS